MSRHSSYTSALASWAAEVATLKKLLLAEQAVSAASFRVGWEAGIDAVRRLGHVKPLVGGGVDRHQAEYEMGALTAPAAPKEEE